MAEPMQPTLPVTPTLDAKLIASDGEAGDFLGFSVAVDGDTALIGAYKEGDNGNDAGAAYLYTLSGGIWSEEAKLLASDGAFSDEFGYSVALSGDTAVVGAHSNDDNGLNAGAVYVFVHTGNVWSEQAKLVAADTAAGDDFGFSVAVDGDTILVGAPRDDVNGGASGSAYLFTRTGGVWSQLAKLTATDGATSDYFGNSVALAGGTAIIGARFDDDNGSDAGSAYVFTRNGGAWSQEAKLTASDAAENDRFGYSVALDDQTAVIGAQFDDDGGNASGSAYIFVNSGGNWIEEDKLVAADAASDDQFGYSVAISGNSAVIGVRYDDDAGGAAGAAYLFVRNGSSWSQEAKLTADDGATNDAFGSSVAADGSRIVVGSIGDDDNGASSGSAYLFSTPVTFEDTVYFTTVNAGILDGLDVEQNDIVRYDGVSDTVSLYFDGDAAGLPSSADINAFLLFNNGIIMSFKEDTIVPGVSQTVADTDLVWYQLNGNFIYIFDGSDVGLFDNEREIDAISVSPNGKLLASIASDLFSGAVGDEDLFEFTSQRWGANTSGSWELYFDGSATDFVDDLEDVDAAWVDPATGSIYLSTVGAFDVNGIAGSANDIILCEPASSDPVQSCGLSVYLTGDAIGLAGLGLEALEIAVGGLQASAEIDGLSR